jgi:hypothetical protein
MKLSEIKKIEAIKAENTECIKGGKRRPYVEPPVIILPVFPLIPVQQPN